MKMEITMFRSRALLFAPLFLALTGVSWGAPRITSVEGDVLHGAQLKIVGGEFGTKSPAAPYLWAPFEDDMQPSVLGRAREWSNVTDMAFQQGESADGSGALKATSNRGVWTAAVDAAGFAWNDYLQKTYLFRKIKRNFPLVNNYEVQYDFDQGGRINWKLLRLWPATGSSHSMYGGRDALVVEAPSGHEGSIRWYSDISLVNSTDWKTEEFVIQANSAGQASDGKTTFLINGQQVVSWESLRLKFSDDPSGDLVRIYVVHGVRANVTFPEHYRYWADDVYLDTTWARVMVGNAPTLEQSTHREIQIPVAWSQNDLTIMVNLRGFPRGATPYLFVIDANGSASDGFPLGALPKSPDSVVVQ